ncbi:MAG: helix-turn-helix transcriptional regulator [Oscillospiraceae bacterium]|nr:helix-turn-helix transcriptional regulator [Oscillospiraceae bacterium]
MTVYDFKEQKENGEIWPSVFVCSTCKKEAITTGIRFYREVHGMSKRELADHLGIQTCHLWRYETGENQCPVDVYLRISKILGVEIDKLSEKLHK